MRMEQVADKSSAGDERGATAIEFALIAPVFLALVLGIFHLSLLGFTVANLNYAVEKGARCDAIATDCPDVVNVLLRAEPRSCVYTDTNGSLRHVGECDSDLPVERADLSDVDSAVRIGMLPSILSKP